MKLGFGALGAKIRTNIEGMKDPMGAANKFADMANNTTDPAKKQKYMQLADQWGGTALQGGFLPALMSGGLGIPMSASIMPEGMDQNPYLATGSTAGLSSMSNRA